jgi:ribose-phosphate pyrophosphokinase
LNHANNTLLLGFPECDAAARRVAETAGLAYECIEIHRFPDGESLVRLPETLPGEVIVYRTLDHPNDKLVELMLCAHACRERDVNSLTLIAPYLCYMRQDAAFRPGEAVSQHIVGAWLARMFQRVITVDPHLHRLADLGAALPGAKAVTLAAAPLVGDFLARRAPGALLLGPDEESRQWVSRIAELAGSPWAVALKRRSGDREVEIELPDGPGFEGTEVVLVDDVASTGHTLAGAAHRLRQRGAARVSCLVIHPVFSGGALETLANAGIEDVWSTDSIAHETNVVALAGLLAGALAGASEREPV